MLFSLTQVLAVLTLSSSVLGSPTPVLETSIQANSRRSLGDSISAQDITDAADAVVKLLHNTTGCAQQLDHESQFTQSTVQNLASQYPDKNVIAFYNQNSTHNFTNGVHAHYTLDTGCGSQGYEIWVFDQGTFERAGADGYVNWAFTGAWARSDGGNGPDVTFYPVGDAQPSSKRSVADLIRNHLLFSYSSAPGSNSSIEALHDPVSYIPPAAGPPSLPPTGAPTSGKNMPDGNYLVECKSANGTSALGLAWYANLVPGENVGQQPNDLQLLAQTSWSISGDANTNFANSPSSHDAWLFPVGALVFEDTNTTVHWSIYGQATSDNVTTGQTAGFADNGYEHFWMYKDAGDMLFKKDSWSCNSLYYAW